MLQHYPAIAYVPERYTAQPTSTAKNSAEQSQYTADRNAHKQVRGGHCATLNAVNYLRSENRLQHAPPVQTDHEDDGRHTVHHVEKTETLHDRE